MATKHIAHIPFLYGKFNLATEEAVLDKPGFSQLESLPGQEWLEFLW